MKLNCTHKSYTWLKEEGDIIDTTTEIEIIDITTIEITEIMKIVIATVIVFMMQDV